MSKYLLTDEHRDQLQKLVNTIDNSLEEINESFGEKGQILHGQFEALCRPTKEAVLAVLAEANSFSMAALQEQVHTLNFYELDSYIKQASAKLLEDGKDQVEVDKIRHGIQSLPQNLSARIFFVSRICNAYLPNAQS